MICVDIETSALPTDRLALVKPEFLPAGNLKDPEKIKASIAEKETAWVDRAALSPLTGHVLAIGLLIDEPDFSTEPDGTRVLTGQETDMLMDFWKVWDGGCRFVGFNLKEFDFRFLKIRSHILGIPVPKDLFEGRWWNSRITDLQEVFCAYSRDVSGFSLDAICRACGLGGKPEGVTGKDFARMFVDDREKALEYVRNDLLLTQKLAARLGIQ